jgi:hypothetical protein
MGYESSWDRPHFAGDEENWQESDCYWFYDAAAGVGGWHRIGQYPNLGQGQSSIFLYAEGGQRFLDRSISIGSNDCSRSATGQVTGRSSVEPLTDRTMHYRYAAPDAELNCVFSEGFYEPRDWVTGAFHQRATEKGHLEEAGRLKGSVRIGQQRYEINALAHRDRSWGSRNLSGLDVLWFCNGTTGPELSWAAMKVRYAGGQSAAVGFVARGEVTQDINAIRANVVTAEDGVTPLRAALVLSTEDGDLSLSIQPIQGFIQRIAPGPFIVTDHSSFVTAEGKTGFADLGLVLNALRGEYLPGESELVLTCAGDGLSDFIDLGTNLLSAFDDRRG